MHLSVRPMRPDEVGFAVDYFHNATAEHLELMGVDPSRLPAADLWRKTLEEQLRRPAPERANYLVIWLADDRPVGFSTVNKIVFGDHAFMHLHVVAPDDRAKGIGAECVKRSIPIYFRELELKRLFCEPNAFNVAPNRTLQHAGFRYVKTHMTVPGPINYHQAVARWVVEA